MNGKFDYRKFYKDYYGIDFGSDYVIHHIDFNNDNNDISNLLLLPNKLYRRYMFALNGFEAKCGVVNISFKIEENNGNMYGYNMMKMLCETMEEINLWVNKKADMDARKSFDSFHN